MVHFGNINLHRAKKIKDDEFYTQITDIENELIHYKQHFKDKVVLCNCDNPVHSAFWKYFHLNFAELGLKKLIATYYNGRKASYKTEYIGGNDEDINIGVKKQLKGNGDFRNQECLGLLNECDIVCTNPPFSLFRSYISVLMKHNKKFLIIGNKNAVTYKDFFQLLKDNKVWTGCTNVKDFLQPNGDIKKFGNIGWFTNLKTFNQHQKIALQKVYIPELYPRFDNIPSVININKIKDIPVNYNGWMAVPITILDKDASQFEIVDLLNRYAVLDYFGVNKDVKSRHSHCCNIRGIPTYCRVVIRKIQ